MSPNNGFVRSGWEFDERWSIRPELSQQRFIWCSWYDFTGWVKPQLPAVHPLFSTSMDLVLTCYMRAFCVAVTSNTNMQNLAFIKKVFLFLFFCSKQVFWHEEQNLSHQRAAEYNTIHSHNNEGRQKVVFRYACNLFVLCATHSSGWWNASNRNHTT